MKLLFMVITDQTNWKFKYFIGFNHPGHPNFCANFFFPEISIDDKQLYHLKATKKSLKMKTFCLNSVII